MDVRGTALSLKSWTDGMTGNEVQTELAMVEAGAAPQCLQKKLTEQTVMTKLFEDFGILVGGGSRSGA